MLPKAQALAPLFSVHHIFFFVFLWRIQSIIYNTWAVAIGCGPCARSYINEESNFREMLMIIFKALVKNLIKENFYEKRKNSN